MTTKIYEDYSAFFERKNIKENGVSKLFAEANPDFEKQNEKNEGSWNCAGCTGCAFGEAKYG